MSDCTGFFIIKGGRPVFIKLVFAKNELNGVIYRCPYESILGLSGLRVLAVSGWDGCPTFRVQFSEWGISCEHKKTRQALRRAGFYTVIYCCRQILGGQRGIRTLDTL